VYYKYGRLGTYENVNRTEKQVQIQTKLPLTLIPIRIDLDIQPFRPDPPLPMPQNARDFGIDETSVAYRAPDVTPAFRLKDAFLWNLHEALMPPDHFAKILVDELDLPVERKPALISQITVQIRTQLEEYASVALHPLFHNATVANQQGATVPVVQPAAEAVEDTTSTPAPATNGATPITNGATNGDGAETPISIPNGVTATAEPIPSSNDDIYNPDDTYRCIIRLTINLSNRLYSDKFEWSLLHPPGFAETFAKQTCADLGMASEWVPVMAHAIYEAVLRAKREACENGGLVGYGEIDNDAAEGVEAGWRYEPERLAAEWEPVIEDLSKEEIEMREKERERQMRRMRRETARFSTTTNMIGGMPQPGDYFADPAGGDTPMGRGERSKKKRRFRSLSPVGRDTPDAGGLGGAGPALQDWYTSPFLIFDFIVTNKHNRERATWRCEHCRLWGAAVWAVRDGPSGPRTLCHNCGLLYERDKRLPPWSKDLFVYEKSFAPAR
jgi:chromatin structure-remodeling complex subunit SFH1